MERLPMTTRDLMLLTLLALAGCTSAEDDWAFAPLEEAPSSYCSDQHALGPSFTQADLQARISERNAALPEGYQQVRPEILRRPPPGFPRCAAETGIDGVCDIVFDINAEGRTENIMPVCSSRLFESNARATVSVWAFEPPGDGPRPAIVNRVVFKLEDEYTTPAPPAQAAEPGPETE
jgi:outer membrane biosynthesis protein TonB